MGPFGEKKFFEKVSQSRKYSLAPLSFLNDIIRRDRLKSAPYLRLKNIQRTTIGNNWKNFFSKKNFDFFSKSNFLESRTMPKNSKKRPFRLIKRFSNRKFQKNARGYPLIESENFRKKVASCRKKRKKSNERKPLVSHLLLEA